MAAKGKTPLNINIDPRLLEKIDDYRFANRVATRTEAIEALLWIALKSKKS